MKLFKVIKEYIRGKPKIKKAIGIILIFIGFIALITPFTPFTWLIFVGLELLGLRVLLSDKSSIFLRDIKKALDKLLKFWKRK